MTIEVTVPLVLEASMSFRVDDDATPEQIKSETEHLVAVAQRVIDNRGNDPETGIYYVIKGHEAPGLETVGD